VLTTELVLALVPRTISPGLSALPVLQVVLPLSLVHRTVHVFVDSVAISFVVGPESIVNVSIDMNEPAFAARLVHAPLAHILGPIRPHLFPKPISEPALPLSSIDGASFEFVGWLLGAGLVDVELVLRHCLLRLLIREVLAAPYLLAPQH